MTMVVAGSGILGLSVAECASRRGERVVVLDTGQPLQGSAAAAAQLGLKGQSVFRSADFGFKISGQRMYEHWLRQWCGEGTLPSWFRRGLGRERFLNPEDRLKHKTRICKHEQNPRFGWQGPSLVHDGASGLSLTYVHEASVDAQQMLQALRDCLVLRGVEFLALDARDVAGVVSLRPRSVVLAVGAWSEDVVPFWTDRAEAFFTARGGLAASRLSLGATIDCGAIGGDLDLQAHVIEGVTRPGTGDRLSITCHADRLSVTSLSCPVASTQISKDDGQTLVSEQGKTQELLGEFGLHFKGQTTLRAGLRLRATNQDMVCRVIPLRAELSRLSRPTPLPRVILFTGANKSGYLYGPALAPAVVSLHDEGGPSVSARGCGHGR